MIEIVQLLANDISKICPPTHSGALSCGLSSAQASQSNLHNILEIVFNIIGGIALLVVVIAGLRYITSAGDPQKAAGARNTIIFALVGLVIAISAKAIITFVVQGTAP